MKLREVIGFLLLVIGVVGVVGGVGAVARETPIGWASIVAGTALNVASYRLLRPSPETGKKHEAAEEV